MSPRAAWRLDSLGFDAYDYVAGKADWLAFGLAYEGDAQLAGSVLATDVPTCGFRDQLGDVRAVLEESRFGQVVALNGEGIVMGRLTRDALAAPKDTTVDALMREGPATVRPSEELGRLLQRMRCAGIDGILVTRSDGRLLGLLERDRGERAVGDGT
ncbi:MAG TPA: CBS domain-containing protein [Nitriliruptorales bacterium]|nr:CBS domain-containing protein [Nitriliruptorales bacterium]